MSCSRVGVVASCSGDSPSPMKPSRRPLSGRQPNKSRSNNGSPSPISSSLKRCRSLGSISMLSPPSPFTPVAKNTATPHMNTPMKRQPHELTSSRSNTSNINVNSNNNGNTNTSNTNHYNNNNNDNSNSTDTNSRKSGGGATAYSQALLLRFQALLDRQERVFARVDEYTMGTHDTFHSDIPHGGVRPRLSSARSSRPMSAVEVDEVVRSSRFSATGGELGDAAVSSTRSANRDNSPITVHLDYARLPVSSRMPASTDYIHLPSNSTGAWTPLAAMRGSNKTSPRTVTGNNYYGASNNSHRFRSVSDDVRPSAGGGGGIPPTKSLSQASNDLLSLERPPSVGATATSVGATSQQAGTPNSSSNIAGRAVPWSGSASLVSGGSSTSQVSLPSPSNYPRQQTIVEVHGGSSGPQHSSSHGNHGGHAGADSPNGAAVQGGRSSTDSVTVSPLSRNPSQWGESPQSNGIAWRYSPTANAMPTQHYYHPQHTPVSPLTVGMNTSSGMHPAASATSLSHDYSRHRVVVSPLTCPNTPLCTTVPTSANGYPRAAATAAGSSFRRDEDREALIGTDLLLSVMSFNQSRLGDSVNRSIVCVSSASSQEESASLHVAVAAAASELTPAEQLVSPAEQVDKKSPRESASSSSAHDHKGLPPPSPLASSSGTHGKADAANNNNDQDSNGMTTGTRTAYWSNYEVMHQLNHLPAELRDLNPFRSIPLTSDDPEPADAATHGTTVDLASWTAGEKRKDSHSAGAEDDTEVSFYSYYDEDEGGEGSDDGAPGTTRAAQQPTLMVARSSPHSRRIARRGARTRRRGGGNQGQRRVSVDDVLWRADSHLPPIPVYNISRIGDDDDGANGDEDGMPWDMDARMAELLRFQTTNQEVIREREDELLSDRAPRSSRRSRRRTLSQGPDELPGGDDTQTVAGDDGALLPPPMYDVPSPAATSSVDTSNNNNATTTEIAEAAATVNTIPFRSSSADTQGSARSASTPSVIDHVLEEEEEEEQEGVDGDVGASDRPALSVSPMPDRAQAARHRYRADTDSPQPLADEDEEEAAAAAVSIISPQDEDATPDVLSLQSEALASEESGGQQSLVRSSLAEAEAVPRHTTPPHSGSSREKDCSHSVHTTGVRIPMLSIASILRDGDHYSAGSSAAAAGAVDGLLEGHENANESISYSNQKKKSTRNKEGTTSTGVLSRTPRLRLSRTPRGTTQPNALGRRKHTGALFTPSSSSGEGPLAARRNNTNKATRSKMSRSMPALPHSNTTYDKSTHNSRLHARTLSALGPLPRSAAETSSVSRKSCPSSLHSPTAQNNASTDSVAGSQKGVASHATPDSSGRRRRHSTGALQMKGGTTTMVTVTSTNNNVSTSSLQVSSPSFAYYQHKLAAHDRTRTRAMETSFSDWQPHHSSSSSMTLLMPTPTSAAAANNNNSNNVNGNAGRNSAEDEDLPVRGPLTSRPRGTSSPPRCLPGGYAERSPDKQPNALSSRRRRLSGRGSAAFSPAPTPTSSPSKGAGVSTTLVSSSAVVRPPSTYSPLSLSIPLTVPAHHADGSAHAATGKHSNSSSSNQINAVTSNATPPASIRPVRR